MKENKGAEYVKELLDEELGRVTGGAPVENWIEYAALLPCDKTITAEQREKILYNLAYYICYDKAQDRAHRVPFDPDIDWVEKYNSFINKQNF